ncbi:MAG: hypothetical protein R2764_25705 [Bacteroidales bacterium]
MRKIILAVFVSLLYFYAAAQVSEEMRSLFEDKGEIYFRFKQPQTTSLEQAYPDHIH